MLTTTIKLVSCHYLSMSLDHFFIPPPSLWEDKILAHSKVYHIKGMLGKALEIYQEHEGTPPHFKVWEAIKPIHLFHTNRMPLVSSQFNEVWFPAMQEIMNDLMNAQNNELTEEEQLHLIQDDFFLELSHYTLDDFKFSESLQ